MEQKTVCVFNLFSFRHHSLVLFEKKENCQPESCEEEKRRTARNENGNKIELSIGVEWEI